MNEKIISDIKRNGKTAKGKKESGAGAKRAE